MFVSYAAVVALAGQLSARVVVMAIVVVHAVVLLGPPLASTDIFSYQAYARMGATYGINPYTHSPYAINLDGVFPYIGAKWSTTTPSAYGPVFTVSTYLLAPLTIAASVFAYKSIAALASLALVAVVWRCARLRGSDPVKAAALVGLNPLLVIYGVGGGHNDLLMLLVMVGGVYAILASREGLGGGLSMLAIGVKLTAGLVLPFALAAGGPAGLPKGGRRRLVLGAGVGLAALAALSFGVFGTGSFHMLGAVITSQREGGWQSIPGVISSKLGLPDDRAHHRLRPRRRVHAHPVLAAAAGVAGPDRLDRRRRLGDAGHARGLELAAAVVRRLAAAAGRAGARSPAGHDRDRLHRRRPGDHAARVHPARIPVTRWDTEPVRCSDERRAEDLRRRAS